VRYGLLGLFTVDQNERAVKTVFGRAQRLDGDAGPPPTSELEAEERERYAFPALKIIPPGGPYFKMPWERVHKVSVATQTVSMAYDPETPSANAGGTMLDAVTKDQLNTGLTGQIRYRVSESHIYAYLFGVKNPLAHVMGFFISVLRQRIANFEAPPPVPVGVEPVPLEELAEEGIEALAAAPIAAPDLGDMDGVSINDLRKNLRDLNDHMLQECQSSGWRYGLVLDASLITGIDPPPEVDSALAAINTAHNHVSSEISLAKAGADQKLVQSKRAVEIATLEAQAEVEPLLTQAEQLAELERSGEGALEAYLRNLRLGLLEKARRVVKEVR
jgi:regulator of protease activity HflC (stomatin/prohibitin superfamily)